MAIHSIILLDTSCNKIITYQYDVDVCTNKQISLKNNFYSNSFGTFNIYVDSTGTTAIYTGVTRNDLVSGLTVSINC